MAYVVNAMDEEEQKQNGQQTQGQFSPGGVVQTSSGQGSTISGSGAGATPKKSSSGSNWTNLTTYLDANKGEGQRMADTRQDNIQQDVDTQTGQIKEQNKAFLQGQGIYDTAGNLNSGAYDASKVQKDFSGTDFTKVGQQDFAKYYNQDSNKSGNMKFSDQKPEYKIPDPGDIKNQSTNFGWRVAELQDEFGKDKYDRGLQNLDAYLLGSSNLADQRLNATQKVKDYAAGPDTGAGEIQKAYDQFGAGLKGYDQAVDQSRNAYKSAYDKSLGNLANLWTQSDKNLKSMAPKLNTVELDAKGFIPGTNQKPQGQVFKAPNGKMYSIGDQNSFNLGDARNVYDQYSKVAGLTGQKVGAFGDYEGMYKSALQAATDKAIADLTARNQAAPANETKTSATMGNRIPDFTPAISMENGNVRFNKDSLISPATRAANKGLEQLASGAKVGIKKVEAEAPKPIKNLVGDTKKGFKNLFGGGGSGVDPYKNVDNTPKTRDVVAMGNLANAYDVSGLDNIDFNALIANLQKNNKKK